MNLEKLVWANPIWEFITESFDLLWAKPFENIVFSPQSQKAKILDFQTPPAAPAPAPDELSNPAIKIFAGRTLKTGAGRTLKRTGMEYFRTETLAVDVIEPRHASLLTFATASDKISFAWLI